MGNWLGCSAAGERLVTAARDGDVIEAQKLVEMNPGLARYLTFAGLSSPLHAAAARGHAEERVTLFFDHYIPDCDDVAGEGSRLELEEHLWPNSIDGSVLQWSMGGSADSATLQMQSSGGHARCIRLLAVDVYPDFPLSAVTSSEVEQVGDQHKSLSAKHYDHLALTRFINKAANGGITALHLAALNGHSNCVHLLLDLHANISATTLSCASSTMAIGAGSTPLHYAACGGSLKCCQVLLARGASRSSMNSNGWLPFDVARIRGSHRLIPLLTPYSSQFVPAFPPSNYLPLPLMSILQIARVNGLNSLTSSCDESDLCAVCLERTCTVAAEGCGHELCTKCALCLCSTSSINSEMSAPPGSVPCPLCRAGIVSFVSLPTNEIEAGQDIGLCSKCHGLIHGRCQNPFATTVDPSYVRTRLR